MATIDQQRADDVINGLAIPESPDLARMRSARFARIQHQLEVHERRRSGMPDAADRERLLRHAHAWSGFPATRGV